VSAARSRAKKGRSASPGPKPRSGEKGGAAQRAAELLERLLPQTELPSGTNYSDRQLKRQTVHEILGTQRRATEVFERIEAELDSEERKTGEQGGVDDEEQQRRLDAEDETRRSEEARQDLRLAVELEERLTENRDRSRERNLVMLLTTLSVLATIVLAFIGALHDRPPFLGGSAIGFLLSGGGVYALRRGGAAPPHPLS